MVAPALRACALALFAAQAACASQAGAEPCEEALPAAAPCCDSAVNERTTVAALAAGSVEAGRRVEAQGSADWYATAAADPGCACSGELCACAVALGLRSPACGVIIRVGGVYAGRGVDCADAVCWPLQPLSTYAVCGEWTVESTGGRLTRVLRLESFCLR